MNRTTVRLAQAFTGALILAGCSIPPEQGRVLTCYTPGDKENLYVIEVVSDRRWFYSNRSGSWTTNQGRRSYTPPENTVCTAEEVEL